MPDEKSFTNFTFCFIVFIAVFDKEVNISCSMGSISRPISSRDHNARSMDRYQDSFTRLNIFFSAKRQGAVRNDQKFYSLLIYNFCMVVTIFKEATSLSILLTSRPSLAQQRKPMKTINVDSI